MTGSPGTGLDRMFALIDSLPDQVERSATLPGLAEALARLGPAPRRIVLCGMGGSAIAGDLAAPLLAAGASSLAVWRGYGLPRWVGPDDLVLACSYSGNTEETISGLDEALARGCPLLGMSSGGRLAAVAAREGFPWIRLPEGLPPRASLGFGLGALVRVLEGLGLVPGGGRELTAAAAWLRGALPARGASPAGPDPDGNPDPAAAAGLLRDRIPVIFTAGEEAHPVGLRLQAQFNENAKVPAWCAPFPELDHNALVGWSLGPGQRDRFTLLLVACGPGDPRLERRVEATLGLLDREFAAVVRLGSGAPAAAARVLSLVQYGDYLSCHLARLRGVDPVPVERIENLKTILKQPGPDGPAANHRERP